MSEMLPSNFFILFIYYFIHFDIRAHLLAFENPNANGRYIVVNESLFFIDILRILQRSFPSMKFPNRELPNFVMYLASFFDKRINSSILKGLGKRYHLSNAKIKKDLGIEFTPIEQAVKDTATCFYNIGLAKYVYNLYFLFTFFLSFFSQVKRRVVSLLH